MQGKEAAKVLGGSIVVYALAAALAGCMAAQATAPVTAVAPAPSGPPRHVWQPATARQFYEECSGAMKANTRLKDGQIRYACECITWNAQDRYSQSPTVEAAREIGAECGNRFATETGPDPRYDVPQPQEPTPEATKAAVATTEEKCPEAPAPVLTDDQKLDGLAVATARREAAEAAWKASMASTTDSTGMTAEIVHFHERCTDSAMKAMFEARAAERTERKKAKEARLVAAIEAYIASHKLSPKRQALLRQRTIEIGMPADEVELIYGPPNKVNRTVGRWGVHEQWVYDDDQLFYIENGKLTSWQD